ncbi:MAG: hypothetical protein J0I06_19900 [Planctomycetes bacterium]|nr:hypothetical protein [Planctomycetota bacterium]
MSTRTSTKRPGGRSAAVLCVLLAALGAAAQPPGKGPAGPGGGKDENFAADRDVFHFLLANRADIKRTVKETKTGVETVTESDKPEVAKKIREHVAAMHARVKGGKGIHLRDPLFAELFKHYDKITMAVENTEKGAKVTESSDDPYVAKLIQAHARVVTKFIENGHAEVRKNHPLPEKPEPQKP